MGQFLRPYSGFFPYFILSLSAPAHFNYDRRPRGKLCDALNIMPDALQEIPEKIFAGFIRDIFCVFPAMQTNLRLPYPAYRA